MNKVSENTENMVLRGKKPARRRTQAGPGSTAWMAGVALTAAIVILLANTPLGMIQLPLVKATTVHIPVILGAILFGPLAGALLGGVFGVCSMISNTVAPAILSFAFTPFLSQDFAGIFKALWVSVGCRVLIGVAAGWLWILLKKLRVNTTLALPVTGAAGAIVNTVSVMGSIGILFTSQYAEAQNAGLTAVFGLIMGNVTASGIPEAVVAALLVTVLGKALLKVYRAGGM